jgi:predicted ribosomally synthesized peptide with SipW-like signal peptide
LKKLLFSMLSLVAVIGIVGGGAFAWFTDTETSSGNTFTAGTLDLNIGPDYAGLGDQDVTLATAKDMAPGVPFGPYQVAFKNAGTLDGIVLVKFSYSNNDVPMGDRKGEFINADVSGQAYAQKLVVTRAYLDGGSTNVAPYWATQIIAKGYGFAEGAVVADPGGATGYLPTIEGLSKITLHFSDTYGSADWVWSPGAQHYENLYLKLDESADNNYEFNGVSITLTADMIQSNAEVTAFP